MEPHEDVQVLQRSIFAVQPVVNVSSWLIDGVATATISQGFIGGP